MKRLLCIVLILLLLPGMALGEGVAFSFTAQDSKLWPQGAAEALNTLLDGMTPDAALHFACAAGALAATRPGAQPSLGTREEVEALLAG